MKRKHTQNLQAEEGSTALPHVLVTRAGEGLLLLITSSNSSATLS